MIPRKIYYAWFGRNPLPENVQKNIQGWKKLNPNFEIIQINENNFDINLNNFSRSAFENERWAFVSDVARLKVIFDCGGFYLDTDVELLKPLENLTKYSSVWALENSNAIASGLIIGSEKNNRNIYNILHIYDTLEFNNEKPGSLTTVGVVTNYFANNGFKFKNKKQILKDGTVILPTKYFAPLHYWGGGRITKDTYAIHHYSATWVKKNDIASWHMFSKQWIKLELIYSFPSVYDFLTKRLHKK